MLQRSLSCFSASHLAPLLASCTSSTSCSTSTTSSSICSQSSTTPAGVSSSSSSSTIGVLPSPTTATSQTSSSSSSTRSSTSLPFLQHQQQQQRGFQTGVWDVRKDPKGGVTKSSSSSSSRRPYFNPEDGPQPYLYWEDVWQRYNPRQKRVIPKRKPVYLEQSQQDALCKAAVGAGLPESLVYGDTSKSPYPRLISAIHEHSPRFGASPNAPTIPTRRQALYERIKGLMELQNSIPGFDLARAVQTQGWWLLAEEPKRVKDRVNSLRRELEAAGVKGAEPGVLFSGVSGLARWRQNKIVERAKALPEVFEGAVGSSPHNLLKQPQHMVLLSRGSDALRTNMEVLKDRLGQGTATQVVQKLPHLAQQRPKTLDYKTTALAHALGFKEQPGKALDLAKSLLRIEPRLMTHRALVLQQRLKGLRSLLGLSDGRQLAQLLIRQPALLHKTTETLQGKFTHLQELLGVSAEAAAALAKQHPQLLCSSTEALSRPVQVLQQLQDDSVLAPAKTHAVAVCLQQPRLLTLPGSGGQSLEARLQLLQDVAGSSPAWQERVQELVVAADGDSQVPKEQLAAVLGHPMLVQRLMAVLQKQQTVVGRTQMDVAPELLPLLRMRADKFAEQYGGVAEAS